MRRAPAGAAVCASLSGVIAGLTVFDFATYGYLRFWMAGSLAGREPELVVRLVPFVAVWSRSWRAGEGCTASSQFFSALVWTDRQVGWVHLVEESQRNNLLPVGVTAAVLGVRTWAGCCSSGAAPVPRERAPRASRRPGR
ncbi:hypothetical protein [Streptomyces sp. NPDC045714]|uniref:hypothetical protein n=1 Tax=Streptomyces sp. NPDC045714 TaxID=3154913 RepID=UPI003407AFEA